MLLESPLPLLLGDLQLQVIFIIQPWTSRFPEKTWSKTSYNIWDYYWVLITFCLWNAFYSMLFMYLFCIYNKKSYLSLLVLYLSARENVIVFTYLKHHMFLEHFRHTCKIESKTYNLHEHSMHLCLLSTYSIMVLGRDHNGERMAISQPLNT